MFLVVFDLIGKGAVSTKFTERRIALKNLKFVLRRLTEEATNRNICEVDFISFEAMIIKL